MKAWDTIRKCFLNHDVLIKYLYISCSLIFFWRGGCAWAVLRGLEGHSANQTRQLNTRAENAVLLRPCGAREHQGHPGGAWGHQGSREMLEVGGSNVPGPNQDLLITKGVGCAIACGHLPAQRWAGKRVSILVALRSHAVLSIKPRPPACKACCPVLYTIFLTPNPPPLFCILIFHPDFC